VCVMLTTLRSTEDAHNVHQTLDTTYNYNAVSHVD
jgi:hypothetical protein